MKRIHPVNCPTQLMRHLPRQITVDEVDKACASESDLQLVNNDGQMLINDLQTRGDIGADATGLSTNTIAER
jgi:hypothetical protein